MLFRSARLRYIVDQEGVQVSDEALSVVARKGDGSMRDSLSTLDQVLAFCGNSVADADVATLLGVVDRRLIMEGCRAVLSGEVRDALRIVAKADSFGYNMRQFCQELIDQFRNIAIMKAVGDPGDLLELSDGEMGELRAFADGSSSQDLQRHLTLLLKAEGEMAHAGFPRLILEMALMKMATLAPAVPVQELLARLDALENRGAPVPRPARQDAPPAPRAAEPRIPLAPPPARDPGTPRVAAEPPRAAGAPAPAPPTAQAAGGEDGDLWGGFVLFVKGKKPMLGADLEQVYPVKASRELLEIGCLSGSFQLIRLQDPEQLAELKGLAQAHFGVATGIKVAVLTSAPSGAPPTLSEKKNLEDAERKATLRREAEEHPLVAAAVAMFDGEIAEVKEIPGKDVLQS